MAFLLFVSHTLLCIRFRLWVYIITYNRLASLKRLCSSLLAAQYFGDNVNVWFRVDVPKGEGPHEGIMEFIHNFRWPHGQKHISTRFRNVRAMPVSLCVCLSVSHTPAVVCLPTAPGWLGDQHYRVLVPR